MAPTAVNRSRIWIGILVVLILGAATLYFVLPNSRASVVVRTARVERRDLPKAVATNGRVEPIEEFQPHANGPSTVEQLDVQLGESVRAGQALLRLDDSDASMRVANARNAVQIAGQDLNNMSHGGTQDEIQGERVDLQHAQVELTQATSNLNTLQALQARGAVSANEVAGAQQRLHDAQLRIGQIQTRMNARFGSGDLANAQSLYHRATVELDAARSNLAGLDIHSPIAGTVYALPIARYDAINPGEVLISVANLHKLRVRAFFDEPVIGSLAAGEPVTIVWDAKPDKVWHGHVTQAPTTITNVGARNVGECLISVDDANGDLLPNTNVTVTVTTLERFGVLSLPREALHTEGASNFVYKLVAGKLVRTPVSIGIVNLTRIEITGGLVAGDVVALGATTDTELSDGLTVRAQP